MDFTTILNRKGSVAAVVADAHFEQSLSQGIQLASNDMASDQGNPPVGSQPPLFTANPPPLHPMPPGMDPQGMRYPSPGHPTNNIHLMPNYIPAGYAQNPPPHPTQSTTTQGRSTEPAPRIFHCSTCNKGFARRSDLARHERIHSGVRPHACDWPGCGKQFIQRSALTVHARVHTGEKPHMCERCGKPFSDSSSLARHRRIHSGKRPYKCPYAHCQKTFTRRTTLTRHQNHHTGTLEEADLQTRENLRQHKERVARPLEGVFSETASAQSTPSPAQTSSLPLGAELPPLNLARGPPSGDYYIGNGSIPPHVRGDFTQPSPRASPTATSPSLSSFGGGPHVRPSLTSHPNNYGPPQPLEPPANNDHRPNSVTGSPHMASLGWASPTHGSMPSPGSAPDYGYPDPGGPMYPTSMPPNMYFPSSTIRRPGSTEPENYEMKPRIGESAWSTPV